MPDAAKAKPAKPSTKTVAAQLRRDCMETPEGEMLGSESDLIKKYGVSRPTLRQAATIVAQEQLLHIQRGVGGGFFAKRPNLHAVRHMVEIFFKSRDVTLAEVVQAVGPISIELARNAANCQDPELRARLAKFIERERARSADITKTPYAEFLLGLREFGDLVGEMGSNRPLSLFQDILYSFCAHVRKTEDIYYRKPRRISQYHELMLRKAEAIYEMDEEAVLLQSRRAAEANSKWLIQDMGKLANKSMASFA